MRAFSAKFSRVLAYLTFVAGLGALCVHLVGYVGTHVASLALPHLATAGDPPLTLVERRRLEIPAVAETAPTVSQVIHVLSVPAIPAGLLAARMDLAEGVDVSKPSVLARSTPSVRRRVRRSHVPMAAARPPRVAAANVFGRSFGVMLAATP